MNLYYMRIRDIWAYLKAEDMLFWLVFLYFLFEYVRPQTLYPVIDFLPYAQLIIISAFMLAIMKGKLFKVKNRENFLIIVFTLILIVSSIMAYSMKLSIEKWPEFFSWVIIFFIITNTVDSEKRFIIIILFFLLYNFKMSQFNFLNWAAGGFSFSNWGFGGGPGWFHNSGEFGVEMCVFFPISYFFYTSLKQYWPKWKKAFFILFPFTAFTGMISSSSRGALIGGIITLFWIIMKSRYKYRAIISGVIIGLLVFVSIPEQQKNRLRSIGQDTTSQTRLQYWKDGIVITNEHPVLGIGYMNWLDYYEANYEVRGGAENIVELPHNIFIQCSSELGYSGLIIFILMIIYVFRNNFETRRIARHDLNNGFLASMADGLDGAMIGFLISGCFVTVLYYPYFWINLSLTVALNNVTKQQRLSIEQAPSR